MEFAFIYDIFYELRNCLWTLSFLYVAWEPGLPMSCLHEEFFLIPAVAIDGK